MLMRTPHRWVRPKPLQPPGFIRPALPVLATKVPAGDGWLHELKHDGFRIVALKDGGEVRLWSRNGRNWSADFVAIAERSDEMGFQDGGGVSQKANAAHVDWLRTGGPCER